MKDGFTFSISEFTAAAVLITVSVCAVAYFHRAPASVIVQPPTVNVAAPTCRVQVPQPKVIVRIIKIKPEPVPQTSMQVEPAPQPQPKIWDNDNIPRASDPPSFTDRKPIITQALKGNS